MAHDVARRRLLRGRDGPAYLMGRKKPTWGDVGTDNGEEQQSLALPARLLYRGGVKGGDAGETHLANTRRERMRLKWVLALLFVAALACDGDGGGDVGESALGESCTKTADCESGLNCVGQVCQQGNSGDTWTDPTSGLTWQVSPPTDRYDWYEAKSYCDSLSLGGHSDWHLPTIGELRTLIRGCPATETGGSCNVEEGDCLEWSCRDDSCSGCGFKDGQGEGGMYWPDEVEGDCCWYWSSSPVEDNDDDAWDVRFSSGNVNSGFYYTKRVRCVRDAP